MNNKTFLIILIMKTETQYNLFYNFIISHFMFTFYISVKGAIVKFTVWFKKLIHFVSFV